MKSIRIFTGPVLLLLLLTACGHRQLSVRDLDTYPQQALAYVREDQVLIPPDKQEELAAEFLTLFFSPWTGVKTPIEKEKLAARYVNILKNGGLGENLLPLSPDFLQELIHNTALAGYPSKDIRGITTRAVNLRVLPTQRPRFLEKCGPDGYPFDRFQESVLWPGTPLILRHYSYDGQWAFVQAGFVAGWMAARDFAAVDEKLVDSFIRNPPAVISRDHAPLLSNRGEFLAQGRIGMILPTGRGQVLFPIDTGTGARLEAIQLPADSHSGFPLAMTRSNAASIIDELNGQPYGWGGLYENRDCSSVLRDYFTVFGVWLPRNSLAQVRTGKSHDLAGLGLKEKKALILEKGIPFLHLLGRKGHVTLYVGTYKDEPVLFHALWGIPYQGFCGAKSKRILIGRTAFTGPSPAFENPEARKSGESLLEIMDFFTDPTWRDMPAAPEN